ncbi:MAG: hypothetical protein QOF51_1979 [Chloroflexota bacterium]|nr:hypothetical protein [Chloroflexota bacterium]
MRADLDAYFAALYGLMDELRYILDPQDVYGADFPSEKLRVVKERVIKELGECRRQTRNGDGRYAVEQVSATMLTVVP